MPARLAARLVFERGYIKNTGKRLGIFDKGLSDLFT
jgi:hypothetical protein